MAGRPVSQNLHGVGEDFVLRVLEMGWVFAYAQDNSENLGILDLDIPYSQLDQSHLALDNVL